mgnify:CR=1 FL=1|jgi:hypothetical protein
MTRRVEALQLKYQVGFQTPEQELGHARVGLAAKGRRTYPQRRTRQLDCIQDSPSTAQYVTIDHGGFKMYCKGGDEIGALHPTGPTTSIR